MKEIVRNGICRYCYKTLFGIKLGRYSYKCDFYKQVCPVCKEEHHLVAEVSAYVRLRLFFKRTPKLPLNKMKDNDNHAAAERGE